MNGFPAFGVLAEEHAPELLRHARRLTGGDGEDVLQEALLRALRAYPRLERPDHLRAWLYRVVTTTAFDAAAKRKAIPVAEVPDAVTFDASDEGFYALLEGLRPSEREVLEMRFVDDLGYDEMARRLRCSVEAARQRVSSAVRALRGRLT